jgi:regulator of replication initiation timing
VGTPPLQKGSNYTQEGIQILEKLGDIQKNLVELQKSNEPLKNVIGNLNRMNNLLTICNKKLDTLDSKIVLFSENNGKRKEPPGFETNPSKLAKTKDDNT